jgi:hypothetical protein
MKKIVFMSSLMIVMVAMMFSTGCTTMSQYDKGKTSISGEVPRVGSKVFIYDVISSTSETSLNETVIVWESCEGEGDDIKTSRMKTVITRGFCFSGLDVKDQKGYYIVGKDPDVNIRFYPIGK